MDHVNLTYPVEVLYPHGLDSDDVVIRLSTAIRIACIDDGGKIFDLEYPEEELNPFFNAHNVHCYFRIEPSGGLQSAVKKITEAVRFSIEKGKLKLVVLSASLDDSVNLDDTWVLASDFEVWCQARRIELGESWGQFWDQEHEILSAGASEVELNRRQAESPDFTNELKQLVSECDANESVGRSISEILPSLLTELAAYRSTVKRDKTEKPPTPRERDTLLTIIAVLCKDAGYDHTRHAKTAGLIQSTAAKMGVSIGETTIEGHLKKITDALATRMK